jgi:hypothetical protein
VKDYSLDDRDDETDNERIVETDTFEKCRSVVHQSIETVNSRRELVLFDMTELFYRLTRKVVESLAIHKR